MFVLDTEGTWGLFWGSGIKKNQEMKMERLIFLREGRHAIAVIPMGRSLAFESQPWEAATGNAERNKSVRLIFLSVLQWSCFCFLPFLLNGSQISL